MLSPGCIYPMTPLSVSISTCPMLEFPNKCCLGSHVFPIHVESSSASIWCSTCRVLCSFPNLDVPASRHTWYAMLTMCVESSFLHMLRVTVLITNDVVHCLILEPQFSIRRHTCLRLLSRLGRLRPKRAHSSSIQGNGRLVFFLFTCFLPIDLEWSTWTTL